MDIIILGGFLGSGKTTLLLNTVPFMVQESSKEISIAILENEIGAVGIDDKLIERDGYNVSTMLSGCACCTMAGEFPEAVMGIKRDFDPDILIVESTGLAIPRQMRDNLEKTMGVHAKICTLVDASRWRRILVPLQNILRQQLADANIIVINKTDLVDDDEMEFINDSLSDFNCDAKRIVVSASSKIPSEFISALLD